MLKETIEVNSFLEEELIKVEELKREVLSQGSSNPLIKSFFDHVLSSKGKSFRPKLALLCANLFGDTNRSTLVAANLVEVLHQATLLHDDVVDNATERRGEVSANITFGNKASVLMGDYLLSTMINISAKEKEFKLLELLSKTLVSLSKGELIQLSSNPNNFISSAELIEIAKMKTGSLIVCSCLGGAYSTTNNEAYLKAVEQFGFNLGIAYQIKDDIIDYFDTDKERYKDLKEGKVNIPFSLALETANKEDKEHVLSLFNKENLSQEDLESIGGFIIYNDGIKKAEALKKSYVNQSIQELKNANVSHWLLEEFLGDF